MCIAVIKPAGVEVPSERELKNCFRNNPNGAGYMFIDNGELHIKKGFMNFPSFYASFCAEQFSKDEPVFIHFRIATHGLVDEGNTHPFPITKSIEDLRKKDFKFKGFGLIHNGIFQYRKSIYEYFDKNNIISDTMLFTMIIDYYIRKKENLVGKSVSDIATEQAIANSILFKDTKFNDIIDCEIGYNKVAIMDTDGNIFKYGDWQQHNGCFYSNSDYKESYDFGFGNYTNFNFSDEDNCVCDVCGEVCNFKEIELTTFGYACQNCLKNIPTYVCEQCGVHELITNKNGESDLCSVCNSKTNNGYYCDVCGKKSKYYILTEDDRLICKNCQDIVDNN